MRRPLSLFLLLLAFCSALAVTASATCAPPAKAGAVICYPTANVTVVPIFNLEGAATGNGQPIVKMILYADNQKIYESDNSPNFVFQDYMTWQLGSHHLVLNAWDSSGQLFQASTNFSIGISFNTTFPSTCSTPSVGVHLCQPVSNTWYPEIFTPLFAAGSNAVDAMVGYVNGIDRVSTPGNQLSFGVGMNPDPNGFTFAANGWDSKGNVWVASATGIHLYYDAACIKNCDPGIIIQSPAAVTDQGSPFPLNATVQLNPAPISAMKAYLDNNVVADSSGPTILSNIDAAPGTHLLTVQAWDVDGGLYKTQLTINVQ